MDDPRQADEALAYWEDKYGGQDRVWSGRVNDVIAEVVTGLEPGRALDLGAGEGGDALWLAARGWTVTAVDLSPTALARAEAEAARAGLAERIRPVAADLHEWTTDEQFDLVTAAFFQSSVPLDRTRILRRAATWVAPGGRLLIVAHAESPPWAHRHDRGPREFPSPEEDLAMLELPEADWSTLLVQTRERTATGPDGTTAVLRDGVVLVQRVV